MLDSEGKPGIVERALIVPPRSQIGPIPPDQRKQILGSSTIAGHYEKMVDRDSAYEILQQRGKEQAAAVNAPAATPGASVPAPAQESFFGKIFGPTIGPRGGRYDSMATTVAKSAARTVGSQLGREIVRGVLGGLFGGATGSGRRRR
jgi:hypothetical protein